MLFNRYDIEEILEAETEVLKAKQLKKIIYSIWTRVQGVDKQVIIKGGNRHGKCSVYASVPHYDLEKTITKYEALAKEDQRPVVKASRTLILKTLKTLDANQEAKNKNTI